MRTVLFSIATCVLGIIAQPASAKILHRWSFDKDTADSVGGAHGKLQEGATVKDGKLILDGQNNWAELPIGKTMEKLSSATFETWFTYDELNLPWARVFDFGNNTRSYLFFTVFSGLAEQGNAGGTPRFAISTTGRYQEQQLSDKVPLELGKLTHVAVTIDAEKKVGKLYINGKEVASHEMTTKPSDLGNTTKNWLGMSQWTDNGDPLFKGSITEFRIFDTALSAEEIEQNEKDGPDKLTTSPEAARPNAEVKSPAATMQESSTKSDK